jgi:hypothetical protein
MVTSPHIRRYNNDASNGDAASDFTLEKKTQEMTTSREPSSLLSSFAFKEKNQKMTTSWETRRHHLLHLRKKLRNDDKPFSWPSSATLDKKTKKMMMSQGGSPHLLHLKKKTKPGRLAVICIVPIYKLNKMNFQHTQETLTNITGMVPFG